MSQLAATPCESLRRTTRAVEELKRDERFLFAVDPLYCHSIDWWDILCSSESSCVGEYCLLTGGVSLRSAAD